MDHFNLKRVRPFYQAANLVDVLQIRAAEQKDQAAFTFLKNGEEDSVLTYGELDTSARQIAAHLQSMIAPDSHVLLVYQPGLDFICAYLGCLYARVVAVPAYPPRHNQSVGRLQSIVRNANIKALLTTSDLAQWMHSHRDADRLFTHLDWIITDDALNESTADWQFPQIDQDTIAFIQYTSGSTGAPKGVMVSHGNLMHNSRLINTCFEDAPGIVGVSWLPPYHDMGLIGGILQPIYIGASMVLMSPLDFLQKPVRWLQAISRYQATTSGGPNFAYDLCIRKVTPEQRSELSLSSWTLAFNGAEPVRAETLRSFSEAFAPCGFRASAHYPCYGMAETTLIVTGGKRSSPPMMEDYDCSALEQHHVVPSLDGRGRTLVSCGRPQLDHVVRIVNPDTFLECSGDQIGEIWVSGPSVARGYWDQEEKSEEIFHAYMADTSEGPFLRTGDLGFFHKGELFITGRIKDLIIVRGQNHYPQDLEWTVQQSHDALLSNAGAAFSLPIQGEEQVVVVQEVKRTQMRQVNYEEIVLAARKALANEHAIRLHTLILVKPTSLPKTSSGKIQRSLCKAQLVQGKLSTLACSPSAISNEANPLSEGRGTSDPLSKDFNIPLTLDNCNRKDVERNSGDSWSNQKGQEQDHSYQGDLSRSRKRADDLIDWLRQYASERINSQLIDSRRCIPPYIVLDFGNRGVMGMQVPEIFGGLNLTYRDTYRVFTQLAAIDLTLASFVGVHHALGTHPVMRWAQPEMRAHLLPLLATGRELGAFALTEPGAGSNPRGISTIAVPAGNGSWRLRGQKCWIGHGSWAGVISVFAQMQDEHQRPLGTAGFLVRQGTKGLIQGPEALTMGMRGMVQNALVFDDVVVGPEQILGQPGGGISVAQDTMMVGRLGLGAVSLGGIKRCLQLALRYANRRSVSTGLLLNHPVTRVRLTELTSMMAALEALLEEVTTLLDKGATIPEEIYAACKTSGTEFLWQAVDYTLQLSGGRGYIESNLIPQMMRDARLLRIFEGPTETLNGFVGSRLMNRSQGVYDFLQAHLHCPKLAQELAQAVEKIDSQYRQGGTAFQDDLAGLRWAQTLTGEIAVVFILLAAVQRQLEYKPSQLLVQAEGWLRVQLDLKLATAVAGLSREEVASPEFLNQLSELCAASIGDLEQTLAGEDWTLDPLLSKAWPGDSALTHQSKSEVDKGKEQVHPPERFSPNLSSQRENPQELTTKTLSSKVSSLTKEAIKTWIETWLKRQLKIPNLCIHPESTFAEYGIDSVMAVELAQDLGEWLDQPLDATILWNLTTLKDLSEHLLQLSHPSPAQTLGTPAGSQLVSAKALQAQSQQTSSVETERTKTESAPSSLNDLIQEIENLELLFLTQTK